MAHLSYIRALRTYLDIPIHYRAWAEATKIKWDNINLSTIDDDQVLFYRDGDYRVMVIIDANYFEKSIVRFLGTLLKIVVTFDEHKCKLVMTKGHRLTGTYRTALKECLFPHLLDYIHRMAVLTNEQSLIYKVRQGSVYHTEYTNDLEFNLNSLLINSNDAVMQDYLHKLGKWRPQCAYRRLRVDLIELRNDILVGHYQLPTEQTMWQEQDVHQLCQHFLKMHLKLQVLLLKKCEIVPKEKIRALPVTFEIVYALPWTKFKRMINQKVFDMLASNNLVLLLQLPINRIIVISKADLDKNPDLINKHKSGLPSYKIITHEEYSNYDQALISSALNNFHNDKYVLDNVLPVSRNNGKYIEPVCIGHKILAQGHIKCRICDTWYQPLYNKEQQRWNGFHEHK